VEVSFLPGALLGVACVDSTDLWVVGQDVCEPFCSGDEVQPILIRHSQDDGLSWSDEADRLPVSQHVDAGLRAITFISRHRGWAVGFVGRREAPRALILRTHTAGAEWVRQAPPDDAGVILHGVAFGTASDGIVIGRSQGAPVAYLTRNGGGTWSFVALPPDVSEVHDVTFVPVR
jgi:photosystem II stability/assembly factor-like uncharacterized protein